jgi:hypothetical protein
LISQPITARLADRRRILLAGCGGGYDVFGALPLYVELTAAGKEVHLANLSFTYLNGLEGAIQSPVIPNLYEVPASAADRREYCPEAWLARWLAERLGHEGRVWAFDKTGVRPLRAAYRHLVDRLGIDAVVLVDGGVDALLRGDEISLGTPAEDATSIAALHGVEGPDKLLACVGLGVEMRDGISHAQVFERIAELTREGGYLGASALVPGTPAADLYADAVAYTFANQQETRQSHVHRCVRASLQGGFGSEGPHVWLSPLQSLVWFFSLAEVARTHLLLPHLLETQTIWDVTLMIEAVRETMKVREGQPMPI